MSEPSRPSAVPTASVAERRTLGVAALSGATMIVEVGGGLWSGSMSLLADGLHMASHALALGIAVLAYAYARRHAASPRFAFGTGKVNALGGYTGASCSPSRRSGLCGKAWNAWDTRARCSTARPSRWPSSA